MTPRLRNICLILLLPTAAFAVQVGAGVELDAFAQLKDFFLLKDATSRRVMLASILLGVTCGSLGSFMVVRRLSLIGDALSHAVFPGLVLGFWLSHDKHPIIMVFCAILFGVLGASGVTLIKHHTRLKEDAAIGMILACFFAFGMVLLTMTDRLAFDGKANLRTFLFGQIATLTHSDLLIMALLAILVWLFTVAFFKELKTTSFDSGFARSIGIPTAFIQTLLLVLLSSTIVLSLRAVGVVLVSAILITPAATAYVISDSLIKMMFWGSLFGAAAGILGAGTSTVAHHLPTGPIIVLFSTLIFLGVLCFAPKHGAILKYFVLRKTTERREFENHLKAMFHIREASEFAETLTEIAFAEKRHMEIGVAKRELRKLERAGYIKRHLPSGRFWMTSAGWIRACEIVRNHRLWELYLNQVKNVPADQVHFEAEKIEHVLGEEKVRELERQLKNPTIDPHGSLIPGVEDIWSQARPETGVESYVEKRERKWKA